MVWLFVAQGKSMVSCKCNGLLQFLALTAKLAPEIAVSCIPSIFLYSRWAADESLRQKILIDPFSFFELISIDFCWKWTQFSAKATSDLSVKSVATTISAKIYDKRSGPNRHRHVCSTWAYPFTLITLCQNVTGANQHRHAVYRRIQPVTAY